MVRALARQLHPDQLARLADVHSIRCLPSLFHRRGIHIHRQHLESRAVDCAERRSRGRSHDLDRQAKKLSLIQLTHVGLVVSRSDF